MATPDVRVRLSAEGVAEVVQALKTIQSQAQQTSTKSTKSFGLLNGVLGSVRGMLAGVTAYLSVRTFTGWISGGAQLADEMHNLSQQIGTTVERTSALSYVARKSDVDISALRQSASYLVRQLDALSRGESGATEVFSRLGLAAKDFQGLDTAQALALVAERLARMETGATKTALAVGIFGRSGARLIPMLNELGAQGLPSVIEAARELGLILDDETAASIESMNDDFDTLKLQAQTLAAQFLSGLAPDIRTALGMISGDLARSGKDFKAWGATAGQQLKGQILIWGTIVDALAAGFDFLGTSVGLVAVKIAATGRLIWTFLKDGKEAAKREAAEARRFLDEAWGDLEQRMEDRQQRFKSRLAALSGLGAEAQTPGPGESPPSADDLEDLETQAQARLAFERATFENELALFKAHAKLKSESEKQAFEAGLVGLQDYFARRRQAILAGTEAEVAALTRERALLTAEPDARKRSAEEQKIDARLAQLKVEQELELLQLIGQERDAVRNLAEQRTAMEQEVLEAQGRRHEAALAQIEEEARKYEEVLARQNVPEAERAPLVATRRVTMTAAADFEESQRQAQLALDQVDLTRREIQRQVDQGLISEIEGQRRIAQVELERLPGLRAIAEAMLKFAEITKDPELIQRARELASTLGDLGTSATKVNELAEAIENLGKNLETAAVDSIADALAGIGTESMNARQALKALARDFAAAVQRMVSEIAALWLVQSVLGAFGGGKKASGGEVEARSGGGLVRGPGTGTSDSILAAGPGRPIRISAGEFVVRARETQRPGGLQFLRAYNAGRFDPLELLRAIDPQAFAKGGFVERGLAVPLVLAPSSFARGGAVADSYPTAPSATREGKLIIGLEEGLMLRSLESPEGERLIVRALARNRRALSRLWR